MQRDFAFAEPARPNRFRTSLPPRMLAATPVVEPEVRARRKKAQRSEDVRLFLLSFTAFFVAITSFIW